MSRPWWQGAVVYQVYPRSFLDRSGDGIGDLAGLRQGLDHLSWLGVDAVWLSPIYPSPMADFGYDVSDYCDVDPTFGTLADLDGFVDEAHHRNIRVLLDWVPNHTSDQHPWFRSSRRARNDPRRDWYVWRDAGPDGRPPNNWRAAFTGESRWERDAETGELRRVAADGPDLDARTSAWTPDPATGQSYLHLFLPEQPDLNWANPEVEAAMHDTLRFWLDRGIDGFRADVIHGIGKDPALPDDPPELAGLPKSSTNDDPRTHVLLRRLRALLDAYPGERAIVGEVYLLSTAKVAEYYGQGDELHLSFNFPPLFTPWQAQPWRRRIERVIEELDPRGAWPTWVLSNHDTVRHATRYGSREGRTRAAAVLLLGLRGTPFLFAGEELGQEDAVVGPERQVDPGGRDGCRAPVPWDASPAHGWAGGSDPWLPWPPHADVRNVEAERADPTSVLWLYRRLLTARRASPALRHGSLSWLPAPDGVLAWLRAEGGDRRVVVVNFTADAVEVPVEGSWTVEVASTGDGEGARFDAGLGPEAALVLRP